MKQKDRFYLKEDMKRVRAVLSHPLYTECYDRTQRAEQGRVFCCHQMPHLLDVARIAYILCLENHLDFDREVVYAAALLHDIGKYAQYENGTPHEKAGEKIAEEILLHLPSGYRFDEEEVGQILTAVRGHRSLRGTPEALERIIYESDKASRTCFSCPAEKECSWNTEKKNMELII